MTSRWPQTGRRDLERGRTFLDLVTKFAPGPRVKDHWPVRDSIGVPEGRAIIERAQSRAVSAREEEAPVTINTSCTDEVTDIPLEASQFGQ